MKRFIIFVLVILGITMIHPPPVYAVSNTYIALGDSVAAGAGLPSNDTICKRSSQGYPYLVAQKTNLSLQHLACSGAKADEGIYGDQETGSAIQPAQLDRAFSVGTPGLITLTVGANDTTWAQFIRQCYYIRCGYKVDTARFATYIADLKLELNIIMARISTMSNGKPPLVIVTGYYNPFAKNTCADTNGLTANEISWLKSRTQSLNSAISSVAGKYSYVRYAPINFKGHELCSSTPWVQGISDPMPFHPTAAGQESIASSVLAKYMRSSQPTTKPSSNRERILDWYNRQRQ